MPSTDTQFKVGSPGRPIGSRNKTTIHRAALAEVLTDERENELWESLVAMAIDGDVPAARLVMEYRYGKPRQVHEVHGDFGLRTLNFTVMPAGQEPP